MSTIRRAVVPYAEWGVGVLLILATLSFWPQYLARLGSDAPSIDPYTHAHAIAMAGWMLLLIAQPLLVRSGHRALHRAIGWASIAWVAGLVAAGMLLAHQRFSRLPDDVFARDAFTFYLPLSTLLQFVVPFALAIHFRRRRALHGRLMLATMLAGLDPIFARLAFIYLPGIDPSLPQLLSYGAIDALLLFIIWSERDARDGRIVFPILLVSAVVQQVGLYTVARTATFRDFADWYRHLALT